MRQDGITVRGRREGADRPLRGGAKDHLGRRHQQLAQADNAHEQPSPIDDEHVIVDLCGGCFHPLQRVTHGQVRRRRQDGRVEQGAGAAGRITQQCSDTRPRPRREPVENRAADRRRQTPQQAARRVSVQCRNQAGGEVAIDRVQHRGRHGRVHQRDHRREPVGAALAQEGSDLRHGTTLDHPRRLGGMAGEIGVREQPFGIHPMFPPPGFLSPVR